jgi:hypothetical protein
MSACLTACLKLAQIGELDRFYCLSKLNVAYFGSSSRFFSLLTPMGGLVISRAACRAISARRRKTAHNTVSSSVLCTGYVVNKTAYEHDFGDNYRITIVKTGLTAKKYVIVLSVLNLVSDFVKCNHPIAAMSRTVQRRLKFSLFMSRKLHVASAKQRILSVFSPTTQVLFSSAITHISATSRLRRNCFHRI